MWSKAQNVAEQHTTKPAPTTEHLVTKQEMINNLQQYDDFGAPVRWVPLNSPDTRDGLARLSDRYTHKNQQYLIEGEMYVPIIDESMSRLGWTTESYNLTTLAPPKIPVHESSIKVVLRSMNLNTTNEMEWLAYETVLGTKHMYENECESDSCQARCHKTGCDSACKGDTCASGCVGISCNAVCKGPGCFAMCIGDQCTSKCEGLNCESRCWGKACESSCTKFSCEYTVNGGRTVHNNVTWEQMYPQYDHRYTNPDTGQQRAPGHPSLRQEEGDYYED